MISAKKSQTLANRIHNNKIESLERKEKFFEKYLKNKRRERKLTQQ